MVSEMALIDAIIKQIESLNYLIAERNEGETRVIVAEPLVPIDPAARGPKRFRQMVRIDGNDDDRRYQAACQLALQCGIDLQDG
jgi:hypothetical protein